MHRGCCLARPPSVGGTGQVDGAQEGIRGAWTDGVAYEGLDPEQLLVHWLLLLPIEGQHLAVHRAATPRAVEGLLAAQVLVPSWDGRDLRGGANDVG